MKTKPITLIVALLNRFSRKNARAISLTLLCTLFFVNATNSYCVTLTKSDKNVIKEYLKDKYFIFYNSNKFDSVLNTENGEVTISISDETWLPTRGPIKNYEYNSINIENIHYKIKHKRSKYYGAGVKVQKSQFTGYTIVKRPSKVLVIELDHNVHGKFKVVLDPQNNLNKLSLATIKKALDIYFKKDPTDEIDIYRINDYDNYLHRIHSGHANKIIDKSDNINIDLEKCPICFAYTPKISDLKIERSIAYGAHGKYAEYGLLYSGEEFERLNKILKNVLESYPIDLIGYKYSTVILLRGLGLYAPAYGNIYASHKLLKLLKDDELLSLYLAAKIAHIELRHGQSLYYDMLRELKNAEFMGSIVTGIASGIHSAAVSEGDFRKAVIATEMGEILVSGIYSGIGIGTSRGFLDREAQQSMILMHAYAEKNEISIEKIKQLFRLLRSVESYHSSGFDKDDSYGHDMHLPSKYRLLQANEYKFYNIEDKFKLFQSGGILSRSLVEIGGAELKIAGSVRLDNGLIMNFAGLEIYTNEDMKPNTTIASIKIGKAVLNNLTPRSPIGYYDKKTIIFANYDFADKPISQQEFVISDIHGLDIKR